MNRLINMIRNFRLLSLLLMLWFMSVGSVLAQTQQDAEAVMNTYLTGLKNGDIASISSILGGSLAEKSTHLNNNPSKYGDFLRKRYVDVNMIVENISPSANGFSADVRMDYSSGETETITFILGQIDGQLKIVDEKL